MIFLIINLVLTLAALITIIALPLVQATAEPYQVKVLFTYVFGTVLIPTSLFVLSKKFDE